MGGGYHNDMLRNILKFSSITLGIVIAGAGILYTVQYVQQEKSPERKILENVKNLEKAYAEDSYGGETPEETLRLFIDALQQGDTDLAAKYFLIDEQQEWREDLAKIKEKGLLDEMVKDLGNTKLTLKNDVAYFTLTRVTDFSSELVMHKNSLSKKWKITEL